MEKSEAPESYVQIVYKEVGSAEFAPSIVGVTPMQLFAIAEYLRFVGEMMLVREMSRNEETARRNKIIVPGVSPDLGG
jgi:hypothetical protein